LTCFAVSYIQRWVVVVSLLLLSLSGPWDASWWCWVMLVKFGGPVLRVAQIAPHLVTASPHRKTRKSISSKAILLVRTNVATANGLYIKQLKKAAAAVNTMMTNITTAISIPPALNILNRMAVVTPRTMLFFNDEQSGKSVVKSGTSTICINETQVESMGLDITQIKPRTVNIADKDSIFVDNYRRFEAKIGDPPNEKIAMCMLPLGSVDPVLDLH